jgi:Tfp pilus assembly protein PilF
MNKMYRSAFRLLIVVAFLTLSVCPVLAQQIEGRVRYAEGGGPVFNAAVICSGFGCSGRVYTDRGGKFRLRFARPGQYSITVEAPGFLPEQRMVSLLAYSQSEFMFIQLRRDPEARSEPTAPPGVIHVGAPPIARREFELGRDALAAEGRTDEAIAHLEKAISLHPKFLEAHVLLGSAYIRAQQLDKAESALRRALKVDSKSAEAHFGLGEVYREQKKYAEAEKELLAGLKIQDSWQGHLALGRLYWEQGDVAKAGPQVGKALKQKPDLAEGHLLAGNILLKAHQAENALTEFEEYLRLEPKGKFAAEAQAMVQKIKKALAEQKK